MTTVPTASKRPRTSNTYSIVQLVKQLLIGCEGNLMALHQNLPKKTTSLFLLLTRVRKKRLKIDTDDNCTHCKQAPEDIQHIFHFPASQPAVNWMRRKIGGISPGLAEENNFSIFTLKFSIVDPNRKISVIWLVANFISAIWHSRIELTDNIIARVLADIKPKIENLKKTQLYSNCFYPF